MIASHGVSERVEMVANKHIPVLVAPDKGTRGTPKR